MIEVTKIFYPPYIHKIQVTCEAIMKSDGVSVSFDEIEKEVKEILSEAWSEIPEMETDRILMFLWERLKGRIPVKSVKVWKDRRGYVRIGDY